MKAALVLLALFALSGCATSEKPESKGPPAQVTVYREPSSRDSVFPMLFMVDGRPVIQLKPGESRGFEIAAGDYRFEYVLGVYNCSEQVRVESGKTYVYRLARGCVIEREDGSGLSSAADAAT